MAGTLNDVTDTTFQAEVLEADQPVLSRLLGPVVRAACRVVGPRSGGDRGQSAPI